MATGKRNYIKGTRNRMNFLATSVLFQNLLPTPRTTFETLNLPKAFPRQQINKLGSPKSSLKFSQLKFDLLHYFI
jgi:hypothetical protein